MVLHVEMGEIEEEHPAHDRHEARDHDVGDRRSEIGFEVAACDRPDIFQCVSMLAPSTVVSCRKISSRLTRSALNSSTPIFSRDRGLDDLVANFAVPGAISTTSFGPAAVTLLTPEICLIALDAVERRVFDDHRIDQAFFQTSGETDPTCLRRRSVLD